MLQERSAPFPDAAPSGFAAGVIIAVSAALTIVVLAHHPTTGHREPAAAIADMVRLAATDRIVHGTMIAIMGALLFSFCVFSIRRNLRDQTVLAGLVAFAIGTVTLIGAAVLDGFVVPSIATAYAGAPPSALPAAVALLRFCGTTIQAASLLGIVAISLAILLWSIGLLRSAGVRRTAGIVGVLAAAVPAVVFAVGGSTLTPHLLVAITAGQAVWYFVVAALLVRGRV